jgi:hypothetical protein
MFIKCLRMKAKEFRFRPFSIGLVHIGVDIPKCLVLSDVVKEEQ